ncbi:glycoside hydrolase family 97 protein [Bacteroidota bacterium]
MLRLLFGLTIVQFFSCNVSQEQVLNSPDGKVKIRILPYNSQSKLVYSVEYNGTLIIDNSPLGFEINDLLLEDHMEIVNVKDSTIDETYTMPFGKSSSIRNKCNVKKILFQNEMNQELGIEFRAFNDGVGFRYFFTDSWEGEEINIKHELTGFKFTGDYKYWGLHLNTYQSGYELEYTMNVLTEIPPADLVGLPMLVRINNDVWVAITEAALVDYAGMYLQPAGNNSSSLTTRLSPRQDDPEILVKTHAPRCTPWRVMILGDDPGKLVESNIVLNLNDHPTLDFSWVKPGTALDDWSCDQTVKGTGWEGAMDTRTMKHFIDFCADHGLDYMSIDAGWYGSNWSDTTLDLTKPIPEIDIPYLVDYANKKDVDVFLWTLSTLMKKQIDEVMPLFRQWGVKGFNVDFFDRDDQETVNVVNSIVKTAAENQFMVEFHGIYKPTGLSRTFPNLLAHEAVLGLEYYKWDRKPSPEHNCIIPFTRMLAGPMDYIVVGFTNRTEQDFEIVWDEFNSLGTRCHHLAQLVIFETGFQVFGDYPDNYRDQIGSDLFGKVTVSWDETRVLNAEVGDYITIARRKDDEWFIGSITDWTPRSLTVTLDFLGDGSYAAEIYSDGDNASENPTRADFHKRAVKKADTIYINMASGGGHVARIYPVDQLD